MRSKEKVSQTLGMGLAFMLPLWSWASWLGAGEVGAANNTANTGAQNTTISVKFDLSTEIEKWKHALGGLTIYTTTKTDASASAPSPELQTSANRWELREQSNYAFAPGTSWFGAVRHERDQIGSFETQTVASMGMGYQFMDTENIKLYAQLGIGNKRYKKRDALASEKENIATSALEFRQTLTTNTVLLNKLSVESGSTNTLLQNDLGLQVKMSDRLSLALSYQIRYNTQPGRRTFGAGQYAHSDRLLTINLMHAFK